MGGLHAARLLDEGAAMDHTSKCDVLSQRRFQPAHSCRSNTGDTVPPPQHAFGSRWLQAPTHRLRSHRTLHPMLRRSCAAAAR